MNNDIYVGNYVRCASKLYQEKKGEIIQCSDFYVMLDGLSFCNIYYTKWFAANLNNENYCLIE